MSDFRAEWERYWTLHEEFYASEGVKICNALRSNQITFYTFQKNSKDLLGVIRLHLKLHAEDKLGDFYNQKPLKDFLFEVTRRLHNFAFSAKSLVDHTRHFIVQSYGRQPSIRAEYNSRVAECFVTCGIADFTSNLRNFLGHVSSPFIQSVEGGSESSARERLTLQLDTEQMQRSTGFHGWTERARNYIRRHEDYVDPGYVHLGRYVFEYYHLIIRFYRWLDERNQGWSKKEWDRSLAIHDEVISYQERWDAGRT